MVVTMKMMVMSINGNADNVNNVVTLQCGIAYNRAGQGGAQHAGGVDGEGEHCPQSLLISIVLGTATVIFPFWSPSSSS